MQAYKSHKIIDPSITSKQTMILDRRTINTENIKLVRLKLELALNLSETRTSTLIILKEPGI